MALGSKHAFGTRSDLISADIRVNHGPHSFHHHIESVRPKRDLPQNTSTQTCNFSKLHAFDLGLDEITLGYLYAGITARGFFVEHAVG